MMFGVSLWRGIHHCHPIRAPMILLMGSMVGAAFLNHHNRNNDAKRRPRIGIAMSIGSSPCAGANTTATMCEALRMNEEKDEDDKWEIMKVPSRVKASSNIIFGTLLQPHMNLIERYDVYRNINKNDVEDDINDDEKPTESPHRRNNSDSVRAIVQLGGKLNGHPGVVHGGILALLIDDVLGYGFFAVGVAMAMTANLNLNYIAPVPANTTIVIEAHLDRHEGRKLFWTVSVTDAHDPNRIYCNATSLYIIPRHAYHQERKITKQ